MATNKETIRVTDIVTAEDIALRLLGSESKSSLIPRWRKRHADFPQPIKASPKIIIWDWNDVEAWAKKTGRLDAKGRPTSPSTDPTQKRKRAES
jgi:predicted DNA-binding transcriptional regulator AlpA